MKRPRPKIPRVVRAAEVRASNRIPVLRSYIDLELGQFGGTNDIVVLSRKLLQCLQGKYRHEINARFDGSRTYVLRDSSCICGVSEDWQRGIRHILCRSPFM